MKIQIFVVIISHCLARSTNQNTKQVEEDAEAQVIAENADELVNPELIQTDQTPDEISLTGEERKIVGLLERIQVKYPELMPGDRAEFLGKLSGYMDRFNSTLSKVEKIPGRFGLDVELLKSALNWEGGKKNEEVNIEDLGTMEDLERAAAEEVNIEDLGTMEDLERAAADPTIISITPDYDDFDQVPLPIPDYDLYDAALYQVPSNLQMAEEDQTVAEEDLLYPEYDDDSMFPQMNPDMGLGGVDLNLLINGLLMKRLMSNLSPSRPTYPVFTPSPIMPYPRSVGYYPGIPPTSRTSGGYYGRDQRRGGHGLTPSPWGIPGRSNPPRQIPLRSKPPSQMPLMSTPPRATPPLRVNPSSFNAPPAQAAPINPIESNAVQGSVDDIADLNFQHLQELNRDLQLSIANAQQNNMDIRKQTMETIPNYNFQSDDMNLELLNYFLRANLPSAIPSANKASQSSLNPNQRPKYASSNYQKPSRSKRGAYYHGGHHHYPGGGRPRKPSGRGGSRMNSLLPLLLLSGGLDGDNNGGGMTDSLLPLLLLSGGGMRGIGGGGVPAHYRPVYPGYSGYHGYPRHPGNRPKNPYGANNYGFKRNPNNYYSQ